MGWIGGIVVLLIAISGLLYFGALIIRPYLIQFSILFAILTILSVVALIILREENLTIKNYLRLIWSLQIKV